MRHYASGHGIMNLHNSPFSAC